MKDNQKKCKPKKFTSKISKSNNKNKKQQEQKDTRTKSNNNLIQHNTIQYNSKVVAQLLVTYCQSPIMIFFVLTRNPIVL